MARPQSVSDPADTTLTDGPGRARGRRGPGGVTVKGPPASQPGPRPGRELRDNLRLTRRA